MDQINISQNTDQWQAPVNKATNLHAEQNVVNISTTWLFFSSGATRGGLGCSNPPPPEIPKALQNRAKLNPIVKTVNNCWI